MDYKSIRELLTEHFKGLVAKRKRLIDEEGRLSQQDILSLNNSFTTAVDALERNDFAMIGTDEEIARIAARYSLALTPDNPTYKAFRTELVRGYRDYAQTVLAHDKSLDSYDLNTSVTTSTPHSSKPKRSDKKLADVITQYTEEKQRLQQWSAKSLYTLRPYFTFLTDYLGADTYLGITQEQAAEVKAALIKMPANAKKKAGLRNLSIREMLEKEGYERLSPVTVNKHIGAYRDFFAWAVKQKLVDENPFKDMTDNVKKVAEQREPFNPEQCKTILQAVMKASKPHHKWGALIAFYTGARLNEIAPLEKADIKQVENIWCFDINANNEKKTLKNDASARVIPVHPKLIELGFLEYVNAQKEGRIFPKLEYTLKNGYGKAIGRWFNESLLPELGLKKPELTFHSIRHTVASTLRNKEVEEATIKDILGHSHDSVTMAVYARKLEKKAMLKALEKLDYGF